MGRRACPKRVRSPCVVFVGGSVRFCGRIMFHTTSGWGPSALTYFFKSDRTVPTNASNLSRPIRRYRSSESWRKKNAVSNEQARCELEVVETTHGPAISREGCGRDSSPCSAWASTPTKSRSPAGSFHRLAVIWAEPLPHEPSSKPDPDGVTAVQRAAGHPQLPMR